MSAAARAAIEQHAAARAAVCNAIDNVVGLLDRGDFAAAAAAYHAASAAFEREAVTGEEVATALGCNRNPTTSA